MMTSQAAMLKALLKPQLVSVPEIQSGFMTKMVTCWMNAHGQSTHLLEAMQLWHPSEDIRMVEEHLWILELPRKKFREAGADRYMLRHETADPEHYRKLHPAEMELEPQMVGIGPFIPHHETQFAQKRAESVELTLALLSIIRILLPKVLLPATTALGTADPLGREKGLADAWPEEWDLWAAVWLMSGEMPSGDFMIENKKM